MNERNYTNGDHEIEDFKIPWMRIVWRFWSTWTHWSRRKEWKRPASGGKMRYSRERRTGPQFQIDSIGRPLWPGGCRGSLRMCLQSFAPRLNNFGLQEGRRLQTRQACTWWWGHCDKSDQNEVQMRSRSQLLKLRWNHRSQGTCIRIKLVEPWPPEIDHGWIGYGDTAECSQHESNKWIEKNSHLQVRNSFSIYVTLKGTRCSPEHWVIKQPPFAPT